MIKSEERAEKQTQREQEVTRKQLCETTSVKVLSTRNHKSITWKKLQNLNVLVMFMVNVLVMFISFLSMIDNLSHVALPSVTSV